MAATRRRRSDTPKKPPTGGGRPPGSKNTRPKAPVSVGVLTPAEIKFARLYAEGTLSGLECARQAGVATGTAAGTGARVRRLKNDPRIRAEISRFRRALAEATGFDANSLAADFYSRIMAERSAIHDEIGFILPVNEWPEILGRLVRYLRWDTETGRIVEVRFEDTSHLDTILAQWTGMTGERRPPPLLAPPMTTIILHMPARSSGVEVPEDDLDAV